MDLKIENRTSQPLEEIQALIKEFYPHAKKQLGFNKPVSVNFLSDPANSANPLGKTAHYDPNNYSIGLYIDKRHPKDILRSFSHELVHHRQNCQGKFDNAVAVEGYAQQDDHLREMEKEAYLEGNMLLRDWEDSKKQETKERKPMNEQKLRELTRKVIEELNTRGITVTSNINEEAVDEAKQFANDDNLDGDKDGKPKWADPDDPANEAKEKECPKCGKKPCKCPKNEEMELDEAGCGNHKRDDKMEEGELPAGLKAYQDKKKGSEKKDDEDLEEGSCGKRDDKMEEAAVEETNQKPTPIHESVAKKKGEVLFDRLMNKWCK